MITASGAPTNGPGSVPSVDEPGRSRCQPATVILIDCVQDLDPVWFSHSHGRRRSIAQLKLAATGPNHLESLSCTFVRLHARALSTPPSSGASICSHSVPGIPPSRIQKGLPLSTAAQIGESVGPRPFQEPPRGPPQRALGDHRRDEMRGMEAPCYAYRRTYLNQSF